MRTKDENIQIANLLFPDVKDTVDDIFKKYPKRNLEEGAMVLRFAPSPTGFLHTGSVYTSMVGVKLARQSDGIAILRIEDTDKKREVEGGISLIVNGLKGFGIEFDEGPISETEQVGEYGPYIQSQRLDIYKVFAKDMVETGTAYPCFITDEELEQIRKEQEKLGVRTGYYGDWAKWRDATVEDIKKELSEKKPFVIRLYSTGDIDKSFEMTDRIKGRFTLRENDMDIVLLKSDGFPTYHFAHPIDDTLMGITLVIRTEEWFASVPIHYELFKKLGFKQIEYAHPAPLMKLDNMGKSKRKLSKRKDPEADVQYYIENGYPNEAIIEYFLTLANSNFYDWRIQNPHTDVSEFQLKLEKFNKAGALFDIVKLEDICKDYIATLSAEEIYARSLHWAREYDKEVAKLLEENKEYCINIFNIERSGQKIRKDIVKFKDSKEQLRIFFDIFFDEDTYEDISSRVSKDIQKEIVQKYINIYNPDDDSTVWFDNVKKLGEELGFCSDRKEYEANREKYKGTVGDIAMVLRVAITKKTQSPDLYQVMNVLGREKVVQRLEKYAGEVMK